jgi:chromosomal replication initiation ATPase DnaA
MSAKPFLTNAHVRAAVLAAADAFGVEVSDVLSRRRSVTVAAARQCVVAALAAETQASYSEIGRRLDRDSTTVLYSVQTALQRAVVDPCFANGLADTILAIREAV